jgi:hypothetical protein
MNDDQKIAQASEDLIDQLFADLSDRRGFAMDGVHPRDRREWRSEWIEKARVVLTRTWTDVAR